jgi:hypothetical protein
MPAAFPSAGQMAPKIQAEARRSEALCRLDAAVPGDDPILLVDQYRVGESELPDTPGDLADLLLGVGTRVARCIIIVLLWWRASEPRPDLSRLLTFDTGTIFFQIMPGDMSFPADLPLFPAIEGENPCWRD